MKLKNEKETFRLGEKSREREAIFKIFVIICFSIIICRMAYLQLIMGDDFTHLSERNQYKIKKIVSPRGKIFDSKDRLVVTNGSGYRLIYLNGREQNEKYIKEISELTGREEEYISKRIKYGEIFPYTKENVIIESLDEIEAHKLVEIIDNYPYLEVQTYPKRRYLYDETAAHTIGYVKKISKKEYEKLKDKDYTPRDIIGKIGIEKSYDEILKGKTGYKYIEVNALNRIQGQLDKIKEPVIGKNIYMGIDMELQKYMEEQFKEDKMSGSFIALKADTGEIISMVSYPTYSLNVFSSQISVDYWNKISKDPRKILTNKSIAGEYPPGSTFKVVSALAFLRNGVNPKEKYYDYTGYYQIGEWKWRAWKKGGHGATDMKKSLVESANPYYYNYADKIGGSAIIKAAKDFNLGKRTGIDITGEKRGVIPSPEWKKKKFKRGWYKGDSILLSIGQGYTLATPIQIAELYSIIANKGWAYRPHVIKEVEDPLTNKREKVVTEKILVSDYKENYYNIIQDALLATVEQNNGTTKILRNPYVKVAAKSGSAQNSHSKLTHAWIA
ncbi:MAG: penicillin-binding protein 2, partial [Fusobacterium sp.]|nr:penicillin-binding protein 2 [Fusobacterium sp.]